MSSRRTLILIAAIAVGALSAFLVFNYVNSADDRAQGDARRVPVQVIKRDIPRGLSGREAQQQGYIESSEIPSEFKPVTAINDLSVILDKVAIAPFVVGQVVVDGMFADPIESQITFAGRVPKECGPADPATGKLAPCVAITISLDQVRAVAGVIVPGDSVNILVLPPESQNNCTGDANAPVVVDGAELPPGTDVLCRPARYLFQSAKVLFVDRRAIPLPGEAVAADGTTTTSAGLITFAVPPKAAQLLASIPSESYYLTLLPDGYAPEPLPPLDPVITSLPGEDPALLTPYGPNGIQTQ